jgi:hypothetical protein
MSSKNPHHCIAFVGMHAIAAGPLAEVAVKVKEVADRGDQPPILIFDTVTSQPVEIDLRGTADEVLRKLPTSASTENDPASSAEATPKQRGPGRPKLGVVSREVTLLPRHWEWLGRQPGSVSAALRKLVEQARRSGAGREQHRAAQESAYRFLSHLAGNLAGFEEATRALFAGDAERFENLVEPWPPDVRDHARQLATAAFDAAAQAR